MNFWRIRYMLKLPWLYMREAYFHVTGRPKGKVLAVGTVEVGRGSGQWKVNGWHIDATGCLAAIELSVTGKVYLGGYLIEELGAIAAASSRTREEE